jgi:hypothetical protein
MHKSSRIAALVAALSWGHSGLHAQAPVQEPAVVTPKLNLTLEQRHVIKEFIKDVKDEQAAPAVPPAIGEIVPQNVSLRPMPAEVGAKVPQVKTHNFFVAAGQVFIVDPKDKTVADVIKLAGE